jgi:hypothetical protein
MSDATGSVGVEEGLLGLPVAEKDGGLARMERRDWLLCVDQAHERAPC